MNTVDETIMEKFWDALYCLGGSDKKSYYELVEDKRNEPIKSLAESLGYKHSENKDVDNYRWTKVIKESKILDVTSYLLDIAMSSVDFEEFYGSISLRLQDNPFFGDEAVKEATKRLYTFIDELDKRLEK